VLPSRVMRPAYRLRWAGPPGWRRIPPVTRGVLLATAAGYVLTLFLPVFAGFFALLPGRLLAGEVWRLVTYPLVNVSIFSVLWDLLLVWSFGSEIEPRWGSRRFAVFLLLASASAAVLGTLTAWLVPASVFGGGSGFAPPLVALIVAWTLEGPSRPTNFFGVLPMTRLGFAAIALALVVFGELEQSRSLARLVFILGGLPVAWLFTRGLGGGPRFRRFRFWGRRRVFHVVGREDDTRVH
jgi:membrane associated rhomboid family serine protease